MPTTTLRAYQVSLIRGEPQPHDHAALRWVSAVELLDVDWVPADRAYLAALNRVLAPRLTAAVDASAQFRDHDLH